jgi:hypothetical protein
MVYLFLVAVYTAVCLGVGWAACEGWQRWVRSRTLTGWRAADELRRLTRDVESGE